MSEPLDADLAAAQEALVAAIAAGGPVPEGFDPGAVRAASLAIRHKRAGAVAHAWPELARAHGTAWKDAYARWAETRPTQGAFRDGWDFARAHRDELPPAAARELAIAEARWSYDGEDGPRPRRLALRRAPGGLVVRVGKRVWFLGR